MIGRLRGQVAAKTIGSVVIDVGGVGYEVTLNAVGVGELPAVGEEAVVHTHLHVREDLLALYGFPTEEEREIFRLLLGASGVGPKLALAVLGTLSPADLQRAVLTEDIDALVAVPGIGKRSAQKLVLDLRSRFQMPDAEAVLSGGSGVAEVRDALEGLGYQPGEIREALEGMDVAGSVEGLLKAALQRLGRR